MLNLLESNYCSAGSNGILIAALLNVKLTEAIFEPPLIFSDEFLIILHYCKLGFPPKKEEETNDGIICQSRSFKAPNQRRDSLNFKHQY